MSNNYLILNEEVFKGLGEGLKCLKNLKYLYLGCSNNNLGSKEGNMRILGDSL